MVGRKAFLVEQVLHWLSPEERSVLVLRHTRHLGVTQIAERMGCPRAAVVDMLRQAEAKVRAVQRAIIDAMLEAASGRGGKGRRSAPGAQKRAKVRATHDSVAVQVAGT